MRTALALMTVLLSGCLVQSFHPFYNEDAKIELPAINGEWKLTKSWSENVTEDITWKFDGGRLNVTDKNGTSATMEVVYFRVGSNTFCDTKAGDPDGKKINEYWVWHVRPLHSINKLEIKGDLIRFLPLDLKWLTKAIEEKKLHLSHVNDEKDSWPLFTCSAGDWMKFLAKYGDDKEAFPNDSLMELVRQENR